MPSQFGANPAITGLSAPQRATGAQKPTALKWKVAGSPADGPPTTKTGSQLEEEVRRKRLELNKVVRDKEALDARLKSLQNSPDIVLAPLMCGAAGACVVGDDEPADVDECNERLSLLQQHQRRLAIELEALVKQQEDQREWESQNYLSHVFGCFTMPWVEVEEEALVVDNGIGLGAKTRDHATSPKIHHDHAEVGMRRPSR